MKPKSLISKINWPTNVEEAKPIQESLAHEVRLAPLEKEITTIAGVDAAFSGELIIAAVSLFDFNTLSLLDETHAIMETPFPYIPGYLSFREAPAILSAIEKLSHPPDLFIVDGQGIAHPRRIGIASFLGVLMKLPTIGCAKSRLVGKYEEPAPGKGSWSPLIDKGETVGAVLRTRDRVRPVFVSPGHLITLPEAIDVILHCATKYRLPEPQRAADALAGRVKREAG
ncbi:MAG: deoxyribonuclease [Geobacteraceae bacterium]|nr:MAG: deoxyribonuclease [Geobacteraceae bacterium]